MSGCRGFGRAGWLLLSLAIGAAACASSLSVTRPVSGRVRAVSIALDESRAKLPEEGRSELILALGAALARNGIEVVPHGDRGAPELIGRIDTYMPGLERHRSEMGTLKFGHGELRAHWQLVDANGVTLGECVTEGSTSVLFATVWGDVLQAVGEDLADFLSGS